MAVLPSRSSADVRRVAVASGIGTTIEWYDFFIYGLAAALVIGPQFFPSASPLAGTLAAFATFAVGFIARPIGGIVFGHFGDRVSRKTSLTWSLLLMGIATLGIGLLPNYASIGIWAPIALVLLRLLQGFALGGEWGGAVLMAVEHAPKERKGLFGSFVSLGLPAGLVLANLVYLLAVTLTTEEQFTGWAWRIPFLLSAVMIVIGLYVRVRLEETPVLSDSVATDKAPLLEVLRYDIKPILLAAGSWVGAGGLGYLVIVYFVSYGKTVLNLSVGMVLLAVLIGAFAQIASVTVAARWSDRVGRRKTMLWGCGLLLVWAVMFFPLVNTASIPLVIIAVAGMLGILGIYSGPQPAAFAALFRPRVRYTGISLSLQIGTILGGAVAPGIATSLYDSAGASWPITIYAFILAVIGLVSVFGLKRGDDTAEPSAPAAKNDREQVRGS